MISWLLKPFLRYADFRGRSGRTEFWMFFGLSLAVLFLTVIATGLSTDTAVEATSRSPGAKASPIGAIAYLVWWLASIVPWLAVQVRRLHDQGRSGWFCVIGASAYVVMGFGATLPAALLFLVAMALMTLPGEKTENRFGSPIDAVDDYETATFKLDPPPTDAPLAYIETLVPTVIENLDGLRIQSEAAEEKLKNQASENFTMSDADALSDHKSARSAPAPTLGNATDNQEICSDLTRLPDGVTITNDGRYSCRGYVFDSLSAAISYSQRRSTPAPSLKNANSAEFDDNRPRGGAPERNRALQVRPEKPTPVDALPSYLPNDVKPAGSGRFSCGGYTFNSLEQALNFAKRRNDRGGQSERAISPFTFVSIPKPLRPPPPKVERAGILDISLSSKKPTVAEHWVADPTSLSAGGVLFEGYLVYFGTRARGLQDERHRSLIDPDLEVSNGRDPEGSTFSYWPNYSELRPDARRSYLDWLSSGRSNPNTPIGYVFIYFYGLERRLVKDRSVADAPAIMDELRRLLVIYGHNHSFKSYCLALLDMSALLFGNVEDTPTPTLDNRYSWELSIRLRVYLGKKVAAGQTLDSNDALCWALGHPMLYPRTPVMRCFAEFCELWKIRFVEQFPDGLSVREPKARLNFEYRSASSEFSGTATVDDLPDVGAISGLIPTFKSLLSSCADELDPLSRFLGRFPAEKESAIAGSLLPEPLRESAGQSTFGQFSQFLGTVADRTGFAEVGVSEIMAKLGFPDGSQANEKRALHLKRLPELFDAAGFGFEPDKRFGPAPGLSEDMTLCVFPAERGGAVIANRPEYLAARAMAEIAALAARADDMVVDAEIESITADLVSFPAISDLDRSRLRAHALAMLANPSKLKAATKRLCELPEKQRQAALSSAVRAVLADQRITPSEVRFLEGLYKALGLSPDEVYSRLHSGEVVSKPATKSALPSTYSSGRQAAGTEIDQEKLARLKAETSAVSSMLASIFKEEEAPVKTADENPKAKVEFAGLDAAHSSLLVRLTDAPMESDAFEAICRNHKLLPSGAIETINDWAFDALDDFVIEEGELICIQEHLIEPIKAMRKAI